MLLSQMAGAMMENAFLYFLVTPANAEFALELGERRVQERRPAAKTYAA